MKPVAAIAVILAALASPAAPAADGAAPLRIGYRSAGQGGVVGDAVSELSRRLLAAAADRAGVALGDGIAVGDEPSTNDVDVVAGYFMNADLAKSFRFLRQPVGYMPVGLFASPSRRATFARLPPEKWPRLRVAFVPGTLELDEKVRLWATERAAVAEMVPCADIQAAEAAVASGKAEAIVAQAYEGTLQKVAAIGQYPYFLAVSRAREPEFLKLDAEAERMVVYDREFVETARREVLGTVSPSNSIRVAFYSEYGFMKPDEKGRYEGIVVDFLDRMRDMADWRFDPVYCSYQNALKYLAESKIDLVGGVSRGEGRENSMYFSRLPMGGRRDFLFVHRDSVFAKSGAGDWNGMSIAVGPDDFMPGRLDAFLKANRCICRHKRYATASDAVDAYKRDETDAVLALGSRHMFGEMQLASFPVEPAYFCVSLSRPDVADAVDRVMDELFAAEPDFADRVFRRHLPVEISFSARLTYSERKWVDHLKRERMKIPVDITPLMEPIKAWKNGGPAGFVKALFDLITKESGLEFTFLEPTTSAEAKERMIRGESMIWTDMAAVVDVLPKEYPRISHVRIPPVYTRRIRDPEFVPFKSRLAILDGDTARIADYLRIGFDEKKFVPCNSVLECFRAVHEGRADCMITSYSTAKLNMMKLDAETDLEARPLNLWGFGPEFALCLNPGADPKLFSILNKCLEGLSSSQLEAMSQRALADAFEHTGLTREQKAAIGGGGLLLLLAIVTIFVLVWLMRRLHRANELAESANRAKSTFLFSMSHDIRTPMNAIMGYTAMAKSRSGDAAAVGACISKIEVAGRHLLSLINQILEMSRIESGKVTLEMSEVDLVERTRAMATIAEATAMQKGVSFEVWVGELAHPRVWADNDRAAQIIQNILGNAVKYTPSGGKVSYTLEERPCPTPGYSMYVVKVSDTGIGMSREFISEIFTPFTRERTSTVSRIEGTGLGMSIVKRIVDLMGGTIEIESVQGRGTTVTVSTPMKWAAAAPEKPAAEMPAAEKPAKPEPEPRPSAGVSLKGLKALLVEDNEMNREVAGWMLGEQGVEVVEAADGQDAVEKFRALGDDLDFILMDIQMPVMDGYAATRAIRELEAAAHPDGIGHVPIIALSANAFEEDRQRSLAAGMDAHVAKPIRLPALLEALGQVLSGPR